jgi:lysophospholipase L1-like esterase
MREVAASFGAPVADAFTYTSGGDLKATLLDGVHPLSATEQAIADRVVIPALEPMISGLRCEIETGTAAPSNAFP